MNLEKNKIVMIKLKTMLQNVRCKGISAKILLLKEFYEQLNLILSKFIRLKKNLLFSFFFIQIPFIRRQISQSKLHDGLCLATTQQKITNNILQGP